MIDMLPTSEPAGSPGGITAARPTSPRAANDASVGIDAASSGVRPPSSSIGSSAQPSGTQTTYFKGTPLLPRASCRSNAIDVALDRLEVVRQLHAPLLAVEQVGEGLRQLRSDADRRL